MRKVTTLVESHRRVVRERSQIQIGAHRKLHSYKVQGPTKPNYELEIRAVVGLGWWELVRGGRVWIEAWRED